VQVSHLLGESRTRPLHAITQALHGAGADGYPLREDPPDVPVFGTSAKPHGHADILFETPACPLIAFISLDPARLRGPLRGSSARPNSPLHACPSSRGVALERLCRRAVSRGRFRPNRWRTWRKPHIIPPTVACPSSSALCSPEGAWAPRSYCPSGLTAISAIKFNRAERPSIKTGRRRRDPIPPLSDASPTPPRSEPPDVPRPLLINRRRADEVHSRLSRARVDEVRSRERRAPTLSGFA